MFATYIKNIDLLYEAANKSKHIVYTDFFPLYEIVEKYVKKHNLIISNKELLVGEEKKGLSTYVLYGPNIFKHANNLANNLSVNTIYVKLFTNVKNEDFTILVKNVRLIQLYNIHKNNYSVINPLRVGEFLMYPPELELIEIYHTLYDPSQAKDWEKAYDLEIKIYDKFLERKKILGGARGDKKIYPQTIINWLMNKKNCILIDTNSVKLINSREDYKNQFQVIADEVFIQEFSTFVFQFTGRETNVKKYSNIIQSDKLLEKHSIYIKFPKGNLKIMDVWNSIEYELVPYTTIKNIRVGSPNVILRFLLLKIWNIRYLKSIKILNEKTFTQILNEVLNNIKFIRKKRHPGKMETPKFNYMGIYVNPIRQKQKTSTSNSFYPYNPTKHKLKNNTFRVI